MTRSDPGRTGRSATAPEVSVVVPVFRNADTLVHLVERLHAVLEGQMASHELILVDDACPDRCWRALAESARVDPRLVLLHLEKNVGQHQAVMAGLAIARGRAAVVMDADLQDPPEMIPRLLEALHLGYAAVFAGRHGRYESLPRLLTSRIYKVLLHLLIGVPSDAGLFFAVDRSLLDRLVAFKVSRPSLVPLIGCTRLPTTSIPFDRPTRAQGQSSYDFRGRLRSASRALLQALVYRWRPPRSSTGAAAPGPLVPPVGRVSRPPGGVPPQGPSTWL